jgi:starch synthase (maltosyl-transferring)
LPGKEEYLDSEKYEIKAWDWDRPGNIRPLIARLNQIRRENPALQEYDNLVFHLSDNDQVLFYEKGTPDGSNVVFVAVNVEPYNTHQATLFFPMSRIGLGENEAWEAEELLTGHRWYFKG